MTRQQQLVRLKKYNLKERIFIMEVGKYIEDVIERHLYSDSSSVNYVDISLKDAFYAVFATSFRGNERVVIGWNNALIKRNEEGTTVPDEILYKSWEELCKEHEDSAFGFTMMSYLFKVVGIELRAVGYRTPVMYQGVMRVSWE